MDVDFTGVFSRVLRRRDPQKECDEASLEHCRWKMHRIACLCLSALLKAALC